MMVPSFPLLPKAPMPQGHSAKSAPVDPDGHARMGLGAGEGSAGIAASFASALDAHAGRFAGLKGEDLDPASAARSLAPDTKIAGRPPFPLTGDLVLSPAEQPGDRPMDPAPGAHLLQALVPPGDVPQAEGTLASIPDEAGGPSEPGPPARAARIGVNLAETAPPPGDGTNLPQPAEPPGKRLPPREAAAPRGEERPAFAAEMPELAEPKVASPVARPSLAREASSGSQENRLAPSDPEETGQSLADPISAQLAGAPAAQFDGPPPAPRPVLAADVQQERISDPHSVIDRARDRVRDLGVGALLAINPAPGSHPETDQLAKAVPQAEPLAKAGHASARAAEPAALGARGGTARDRAPAALPPDEMGEVDGLSPEHAARAAQDRSGALAVSMRVMQAAADKPGKASASPQPRALDLSRAARDRQDGRSPGETLLVPAIDAEPAEATGSALLTPRPAAADPHVHQPAMSALTPMTANGAGSAPAPAQINPAHSLHPQGATGAAIDQPPLAAQIEDAIDQIADLRETGRAGRPELTVRHSEFGPVSMRFEATASQADLRIALSSRDPGFVPAVQAALVERAGDAGSAATNTGSQGQQSGSQRGGENALGAGSHPGAGERYGSSPGSRQGPAQPYSRQEGDDTRGAASHGAGPAPGSSSAGPRDPGLYA